MASPLDNNPFASDPVLAHFRNEAPAALDPYRTFFVAEITGSTTVDGVFNYAWKEQTHSTTTGLPADANPRREGSVTNGSPATEMNNREVTAGTYVWMRQLGIANGTVYYAFEAGGSAGSVTVEEPSGTPTYPGTSVLTISPYYPVTQPSPGTVLISGPPQGSDVITGFAVSGSQLVLSYNHRDPDGVTTAEQLAVDVCLFTDCCDATAITIDASVRHTAMGESLRSAVILTSGEVFFDATGTSGGSGALTYEWYFDDPIAGAYPGTPDATGSTTSHTFSEEGLHSVLLVVTDADGCDTKRFILPVYVVAASPECDCEDNCPSGAPYGYRLEFHDGTEDFARYNGVWEIPNSGVVDADVEGDDETCIYQLRVDDKGDPSFDGYGIAVDPHEPAETVDVYISRDGYGGYVVAYNLPNEDGTCCEMPGGSPGVAGGTDSPADEEEDADGDAPELDGPTPLEPCGCCAMCASYQVTGHGAAGVMTVDGECAWAATNITEFAEWSMTYDGDGDWTATNAATGDIYETTDWNGTGCETFAQTAGTGPATIEVCCVA